MNFSKIYSAQTFGLEAKIIDVETDISKKTLHAFSVVGLPDKAVEESKDRVSAAIKNISGSGLPFLKSFPVIIASKSETIPTRSKISLQFFDEDTTASLIPRARLSWIKSSSYGYGKSSDKQ